ncbi:DUF2249 domain-containing protein [Herpetosiphon giganteus]|uniref:DUF2249 domain-containing protein n=1 Tax=Herpetosiphon giganteus TaxID=2029754 RepID=UPI00195C9095|nr:DUF2249 domain-containing protein [Herpetosiphon giganteus]MBM7842550.1 uncharacterized protein (DUF2249 family) [Herpetosiphon giganteus]
MITATMRVGELLGRYPELEDWLVLNLPRLARLSNPHLRRMLSRWLTLSQLAQMMHLDVDQLLMAVNQALNTTKQPVRSLIEPPAWLQERPIHQTIHVDQISNEVDDPVQLILRSAKAVPAGTVLLLVNSFDPSQLSASLEHQGFVSWQRANQAFWDCYLYRKLPGEEQWFAARPEPQQYTVIDNRGLKTPLPLVNTLEALTSLEPGQQLLSLTDLQPTYLFPMLNERGFIYSTSRAIDYGYITTISRPLISVN